MVYYKKRLYFVLIILFLPAFYSKNIHGMDENIKECVEQNSILNDYECIKSNDPEKVACYIGKEFKIIISALQDYGKYKKNIKKNEKLCLLDVKNYKQASSRIESMIAHNKLIITECEYEKPRGFLSKRIKSKLLSIGIVFAGVALFCNDSEQILIPGAITFAGIVNVFKEIIQENKEEFVVFSNKINKCEIQLILSNAKTILNSNP